MATYEITVDDDDAELLKLAKLKVSDFPTGMTLPTFDEDKDVGTFASEIASVLAGVAEAKLIGQLRVHRLPEISKSDLVAAIKAAREAASE